MRSSAEIPIPVSVTVIDSSARPSGVLCHSAASLTVPTSVNLPLYVTVYPSALTEYAAVFRSSHPDGCVLSAPPCASLLRVSVAVISTL